MLGRVLTALLVAGLLTACSGVSNYEKRRNETQAMSNLKKFQVAVTLHQVEYGETSSLAELKEKGAIEAPLFEAWDERNTPKPLGGYLYTYFEQADDRIGLCAYPAQPGETGDLMICTLGYFGSFEEQWDLYTTNYERFGRPLQDWPSRQELASSFVRMEKRSPS